jgi:hypothetical protein
MPILFLDFDGVLHPEHCHESKHFCRLPVLEDALQKVPDTKVVITSTWRLEQSLENLRQRFSPGIANMIQGVTPRYSDLKNVRNTLVSYQREAECHAWLWSNPRWPGQIPPPVATPNSPRQDARIMTTRG